MEPYKFEENIKEKLEKRTINPTKNSWDKLANSLDSKNERKGRKVWYILGVAASIVGVLFLVSTFFKKDIEKTTPIIVDSPIPEKEAATKVIVVETNSLENDTLNSIKTNDDASSLVVDSPKILLSKSKNPSDEILETTKTPVTNTLDKIAVIKNEDSKKDNAKRTVEDQEITALILQIETLKSEHLTVTDTDIDALLKDAQNTLALEKLFEDNAKTVDAYKLLQDVEADLDKSIRVKFLETLKLNFENIKTAIAQRNN